MKRLALTYSSAVLTKYTSLRSFREQMPDVEPLDYTGCYLYAQLLLDVYMDYKSIYTNIGSMLAKVDSGSAELTKTQIEQSTLDLEEPDMHPGREGHQAYVKAGTKPHNIARIIATAQPSTERAFKYVAYSPSIIGLNNARRDCLLAMMAIVRKVSYEARFTDLADREKVDQMCKAPTRASDQTLEERWMCPSLFRALLPLLSPLGPQAVDVRASRSSHHKIPLSKLRKLPKSGTGLSAPLTNGDMRETSTTDKKSFHAHSPESDAMSIAGSISEPSDSGRSLLARHKAGNINGGSPSPAVGATIYPPTKHSKTFESLENTSLTFCHSENDQGVGKWEGSPGMPDLRHNCPLDQALRVSGQLKLHSTGTRSHSTPTSPDFDRENKSNEDSVLVKVGAQHLSNTPDDRIISTMTSVHQPLDLNQDNGMCQVDQHTTHNQVIEQPGAFR